MKIRIFTMAMVCSLIWCISVKAEVKELTFVSEDKEDFPFVIGSSSEISSDKPGAAIEALKLLGEKLGLKIVVNRVPWKRAFEEELKKGTAQGLFMASYKKEREEFGAYPMKDGKVDESRRFCTSTYVFYKRKGSAADYDGQVLKNLKGNIGAPRGYSIVDDLRKKGYTVEESNSTLTDLKRLAEGRIDVAAALELTGDKILKKDSQLSGLIEKIGTPISAKAYYFMLSNQFVKANPQLAEKIWDTVREIREKNSPELIGKYLD